MIDWETWRSLFREGYTDCIHGRQRAFANSTDAQIIEAWQAGYRCAAKVMFALGITALYENEFTNKPGEGKAP